MLAKMNEKYHTHAVFALCEANSDGDDIIVKGTRIPMLRQQKAVSGKPNLCLSDFLRPLSSGIKDTLGLFATSVDAALTDDFEDDTYLRMLSQTLADRLAEATAEKCTKDIRRKYWGYAPEEQLTLRELFAEKYQGIRPAIGYPSLPDTSVNFLLAELWTLTAIHISLTETGMNDSSCQRFRTNIRSSTEPLLRFREDRRRPTTGLCTPTRPSYRVYQEVSQFQSTKKNDCTNHHTTHFSHCTSRPIH